MTFFGLEEDDASVDTPSEGSVPTEKRILIHHMWAERDDQLVG